ncbi:MAG: PhoH family protein [Betaproteobacteria bacterium]
MALTLTLHQSLTDKQRSILREPSHFLTLSGPAGTSKTYIALARGLKLLQQQAVEKIVIIRSAVEIRSIGFLPGNQAEKLDAYAGPYIHLINELSPKKNFRALVASKELEFHCTSFLRGMTFDYSYIIADEYQNMNAHELETIVTRVGEETHLVLCGDSDQSDLKYDEAKEHKEVMATLNLMPDFAHYEFTTDEIVRSEFVKRYYQAKEGTLNAPNFLTRTRKVVEG